MISILSPAKKLDEKAINKIDEYSQPELIEESKVLIDELRNLTPSDIKKLMGVSQSIAELNFERFARWNPPFTPDNAKQAVFMFNGQAYLGLEAESLNKDTLKFAQDHVRILSGLYGVLKPLDLIQPYRLEMSTKLNNPRGSSLYEFWGNKITEKLNEYLATHKSKVLINLASDEYYKAVNSSKVEGEIITPVFKENKGQQYKTIAVYAKKARGLMTRFIIENRIEEPEALKSFESEGYSYNPNLSTKNEWVFTR